MYLLIPDIFLVPVRYDEEDILNLKKALILQEGNSFNGFINKTIERKEIVIGISLSDERAERWAKERKAMEEYANSQGVTLKIENADFDVEKQALQVENLILQGINVLILVPVDTSTAAELVEKAHKAGIKVISYDRLIQNSEPDLYTSFNNIRVGELQGQFITKEVPRGNYIILSGDPRDYNSKLFKQGAMEYIQPLVNKGDIKIVTDESIKDWNPKNAFKIVEDSLIANKNKIDAILAPNDLTAGAAIEALKEQGLAGKVAVAGVIAELDAVKRIIEGTQLMTVFKDTRVLAKAAMETAVKLVNKEPIKIDKVINNGRMDVPSILITPIAIDKTNIDKVLIDSGYYTKEEVHNGNNT